MLYFAPGVVQAEAKAFSPSEQTKTKQKKMPPFGWNHMRSCNNKTSFVFREANSDTENKSDPRYSQLEALSKEQLENSHPPDQKAPV